MNFDSSLLLVAIATPLAAAAAIGLGLPRRAALALGAVAFAIPAIIALYLWCQFPADVGARYQFMSRTPLGLDGLGIKL